MPPRITAMAYFNSTEFRVNYPYVDGLRVFEIEPFGVVIIGNEKVLLNVYTRHGIIFDIGKINW